MKKLYKCDHSYYCEPENYFSNDTVTKFDSWDDFYEEWGETDDDYNFLFRWDWKEDEETGENVLYCYWMIQRKGAYICSIVKVTKEEEPEIKKWLRKKYHYMVMLWEPFNKDETEEED